MNRYLEAEAMLPIASYHRGWRERWALLIAQTMANAAKDRIPVTVAMACLRDELAGIETHIPVVEKLRLEPSRRFPTFAGWWETFTGLLSQVRQFYRRRRLVQLIQLSEDISNGVPLGQAIERRTGRWFPRYYVLALKEAEAVGRLNVMLPLMADRLQYQRSVAEDRIPYLPYVGIVSVLVLLVFCLLQIFILPVFRCMFQDMGVAVPVVSVVLFACTDVVARCAVVAIVVGFMLLRSEKVREAVLPWTPVIGTDKRRLIVRELAQSMATFLSFGEDVLKAAEWSLETTISPWLKPRLAGFVSRVEAGDDWAVAWQDMKLGAFAYPWLIANAAARQDPLGGFDSLAEWLHEDISRTTRLTRRWLLPLFVILTGIFVGSIAVGVHITLWNMHKLIS